MLFKLQDCVLNFLRLDLFAAYAYTCRIFNAYPVENNRVDKPQQNYPCETYIVFSVIKMNSNMAGSKEIVIKLFLGSLIYL